MNNRSLNEVDTIILGAGISGLTLGYYLNKREKDFLIFESSKYIGGNISTKNKKGFICENGPNTVLLNNESVQDLISDLKIKNDIIKRINIIKLNIDFFIFSKNCKYPSQHNY